MVIILAYILLYIPTIFVIFNDSELQFKKSWWATCQCHWKLKTLLPLIHHDLLRCVLRGPLLLPPVFVGCVVVHVYDSNGCEREHCVGDDQVVSQQHLCGLVLQDHILSKVLHQLLGHAGHINVHHKYDEDQNWQDGCGGERFVLSADEIIKQCLHQWFFFSNNTISVILCAVTCATYRWGSCRRRLLWAPCRSHTGYWRCCRGR